MLNNRYYLMLIAYDEDYTSFDEVDIKLVTSSPERADIEAYLKDFFINERSNKSVAQINGSKRTVTLREDKHGNDVWKAGRWDKVPVMFDDHLSISFYEGVYGYESGYHAALRHAHWFIVNDILTYHKK